MDNKELLINKMTLLLGHELSKEQLNMVRNFMVVLLNDYDLVPHKELPSTEVIDDENIIKHFLASKKITGCSEKTIKQYKYHISRFLDYINVRIINVTTNNIRYYLAYLSQNNSNLYMDNVRRVLNSFFSFCENEEYVKINPCKKVEKIKFHSEIKEPYTDLEAELLRNACTTRREKALVSILFSTGCRREEITKIKIRDINFVERSIIVHGKGNKDRIVYFSARCEIALRDYINSKNDSSEYLFSSEKSKTGTGQLSCEAVARIIKKIGQRSGVEHVHLHKFRYWFGTYMAGRGVPLQDLKEMMGHESIRTTDKHYVRQAHERIKNNYRNNAA